MYLKYMVFWENSSNIIYNLILIVKSEPSVIRLGLSTYWFYPYVYP